MTRNP